MLLIDEFHWNRRQGETRHVVRLEGCRYREDCRDYDT